jgi:hypothetical protein
LSRFQKKISPTYAAAVHSSVDAIDKNTLFRQNLTYPQLWIISRAIACRCNKKFAQITARRYARAISYSRKRIPEGIVPSGLEENFGKFALNLYLKACGFERT